MPNHKIHPSHHELSAFTLGQLPAVESERIEQHILECESCCDALEMLGSRDAFVEQLQDARDSDCPFSDTEPVVVADTIEETVPGALANHSRYAIESLVGRGGMGRVYKARHRMMDRVVAVKVIHREWVQRQEAIDRFRREVKTAASLNHRNIVSAYDAEQVQDLHILVMEYVDGVDLAQTVKRGGPLPVSVACDYILQAAEGLQHAHDLGMVHRDIKPHNLIVTRGKVVKILDFGLASLVSQAVEDEALSPTADGSLTLVGAVMGTPDFISPEQSQDARSVDGRSDIYSLGMTLHFLLAGRVPFEVNSVAEKLVRHASEDPTPLTSIRNDVPQELADVVERMIAKDPTARFQTPTEVAEALGPFGELSSQVATRETRRRGVQVLVASLCVLLVVAFGAFAYVNRTKEDDRKAIATSGAETEPPLPSTEYDLSLVPQSFVEILGGRPSDLLENDHFRDVWTILDDTPLKSYCDPRIAEGLCVKLRGDGGKVVLLKTSTVSAQQYARETLRIADEPLSEDEVEFYRTASPNQAVRLIGDNKLVIGTLDAILVHAEALKDVKPTFELLSRQFQSQYASAFKISTSFTKTSPRGSTDFWRRAYLNMLDFTVNPLLQSDYVIASVDLQDETCMVYFTALCEASTGKQAAHRTMDATRGAFPNLIQADNENLFLDAQKEIIAAVGEAEVVPLADHGVRMEFPLESAEAVRELIGVYFLISALGDAETP